MKQRYQYRVYPDLEQQNKLSQLFGCCRVVWNDALALIKNSSEKLKISDLQKICITQAKKTEERTWLSDVSNIPLQQSLNDLGIALKNVGESKSGKRKGKRVGFPQFKKKQNRQSARFTRGGFKLKDSGKVFLAKIGDLKVKWSRDLPSIPSSVTVIKDTANRYFLSFVVESLPIKLLADSPSIGVDLGLKTFAVLSTGEQVKSPDYSKLDRKIRRLQRRLSKRQKGSNRRDRLRLRIAKLKAKVRDIRKDFLHKLSIRLIRENQTVCLEDLNVSGMLKNRKLSRAISDAGWAEFRTMCEAKSRQILDRELVIINRWEPTSQTCSDCGYRWGKLDLSVRELVCLNCGIHQDRDKNAARNIEKVGVGHTHDSKRTGRNHKTGSPASFVELSTKSIAIQLSLFAVEESLSL